ncbi:hypothetical protein EBU94_03820 [bacterium]|nr:hypothetical protein [bacterium]
MKTTEETPQLTSEKSLLSILYSLTEDQKKVLAEEMVRAILEVRAKEHREMMDYIFTPFYIRWYRNFISWIKTNNFLKL